MPIGPIQLLTQATTEQRRTLLAASLGWMLDAFDAMLYALVLTHVMRDLGMSKATSGLLYTLTLLASGMGGVLFGFLADRVGRKRALMLSILTYSVCSFASGLSTTVLMLAVFRFILGLGMGGEWNTEHPDVFRLLVCFGALDDGAHAGSVSLHPRAGHGWRMEHRRDPGRGNLAR